MGGGGGGGGKEMEESRNSKDGGTEHQQQATRRWYSSLSVQVVAALGSRAYCNLRLGWRTSSPKLLLLPRVSSLLP